MQWKDLFSLYVCPPVQIFSPPKILHGFQLHVVFVLFTESFLGNLLYKYFDPL
jgi:hypothetical protein